MKQTRWIWAIAALVAMAVTGCEPRTEKATYSVRVAVTLPDLDSAMVVTDEQLIFSDLNMGARYEFAYKQDSAVVLPTGFYDVEYAAEARLDSLSYPLRGYLKSVAVSEERALTIEATLVSEQGGFVLAEIFFAGTQTPAGKQYYADKYFVVYNNSTETLYADGLVLLESDLKNTQRYTLDPDFRETYFGADAIYRIPGDGTQYPVAPGGSVLIVDAAMNHQVDSKGQEINPNSFDLSSADFEWYDASTNPNVTDVDNPDVPNLEKIYCYTLTIWTPNVQGNTSFAIGRLPDSVSVEAYLRDYRFTYNYVTVTSAGTFNMTADNYLFPNSWIIDAVNLCPSTAYQWLVTSLSLDAGWTYVASTGQDKTRYGKSVRRKERIENGRRVLQDLNNSTLDFLPAQTADPFYFRR